MNRPIRRVRVAALITSHLALAVLAYHQGFRSRSTRADAGATRTVANASPRATTPTSVRMGDTRANTSSSAGTDLPDSLLSQVAATERAARHLNGDQLLQALAELASHPPGPEKLFSQQLLLTRLTEIDPSLALGYAAGLPEPEGQTCELSVLSTWTRLDPAAAAAHFRENSSDFGLLSARERAAARTISAQWAESNPSQAFEWASELPEEVRLDALSPAIAKLSLRDPNRIVEVINQQEPGAERNEMIAAVARERSRQVPEETAAWASKFTDPEERSSATAAVINSWASRDAGSAAQWVRSLEPGPTRDAALRALLDSNSFRRDPSLAIRWTGAIMDESARQDAVAGIVARWEVFDPDGAAIWARNHPTSPVP